MERKLSLLSSQIGRSLSSASTANIGSKASKAAMGRASEVAIGASRRSAAGSVAKRTVPAGTIRRSTHPGSTAGLWNSKTARLERLDSGYMNPSHWNARGNTKTLVPSRIQPITRSDTMYRSVVNYNIHTYSNRSPSLLKSKMGQ